MLDKLLVAAILLLLAIAAWSAWWPRSEPGRADSPAHTSPAPSELQIAAADRTPVGDAPAAHAPAAPALRVYPGERAATVVQGHVFDDLGRPVAGARVALQPSRGGMHPALAIADDRTAPAPTISGAQGEFLFAGLPAGPWLAQAQTSDGRRGERPFAAPTREDATPLAIVIAPARADDTLQVLVVDADGRSVAAVRVELRFLPTTAAIIAADQAPDQIATSATDGTCTFAVARDASLAVTAHTSDGRAGNAVLEAQAGARQTQVTITVTAPGSIRGQLTGMPAAALDGLRVQALSTPRPDGLWYSNSGLAWTTTTRAGQFGFVGLAPGHYALVLAWPRTLRIELPRDEHRLGGVEPWTVSVTAGSETSTARAVAPGGSIVGSVRTSDGQPVPGARVSVTLTTSGANAPDGFEVHGVNVWRLDHADLILRDHPETHATVHTDARGEYRVAGLHPGPHRVDVFADGLAYDQRTRIAVTDGAEVRLSHELEAAGVVQGVGCGHSYLAALRPGSTRPAQFAILPDDSLFTFAGLAAGEWSLAVPIAGFGEPLRELARVRVEAGRTTWVDMRGAGDVRFSGRLLHADGAPARGSVRLHHHWQRLRADGSFEFALLAPMHRTFGDPKLHAAVDGIVHELPLPAAVVDAPAWHGELRLPPHALRVQLRDEQGQPIAGRIALHNGAQGTHGALPIDSERLIRGLAAGTYHVTASTPDRRFAPAEVTLPRSEPLLLQAKATAYVDVTLLDRHGRIAPDRTVYARVWQGAGAPPTQASEFDPKRDAWFSAATDARGRARILAAPGPALIEIGGDYLPFGEPRPAGQVVYLQTGVATAVELRLP